MIKPPFNKIMVVFLSIFVAFFIATPTSALSEKEKGNISTNCSSIQQSLKQLAKVDSRTRVHLGSVYENALSNFITPLNLRLVKNNQPNTKLTNIQSDFVTKRNAFINNFTTYMQKLEELTVTDCKNNPEDFYSKLEVVRDKRANLQSSVLEINSLLHDQIDAVSKLKGDL